MVLQRNRYTGYRGLVEEVSDNAPPEPTPVAYKIGYDKERGWKPLLMQDGICQIVEVPEAIIHRNHTSGSPRASSFSSLTAEFKERQHREVALHFIELRGK